MQKYRRKRSKGHCGRQRVQRLGFLTCDSLNKLTLSEHYHSDRKNTRGVPPIAIQQYLNGDSESKWYGPLSVTSGVEYAHDEIQSESPGLRPRRGRICRSLLGRREHPG